MISKSLFSLSFFALTGTVFGQAQQVVYWNDSRITVSRPSANLWSTTWEAYSANTANATGGCGASVYPDMCGGAAKLCSYYDSATLLFNGTSITANFLARWNGVVNATIFLDNQLWTQLNTSNLQAEPFPGNPLPFTTTTCLPVWATQIDLSPSVEHNVTIMVPPSDPNRGYVMLFQSFEYTPLANSTTVTSGVASSEALATNSTGSKTKVVIGGVIAGVVVLLAGVAAFFIRRKQQAKRQQGPIVQSHFIGTFDNVSAETLAAKKIQFTDEKGENASGFKVVSVMKRT